MVAEGECRSTPGQSSAAYKVEPGSEVDLVRCSHRSSSEFAVAEVGAVDVWPSEIVTDSTG